MVGRAVICTINVVYRGNLDRQKLTLWVFCLTNFLLYCIINIVKVKQSKKHVDQCCYSESEWKRLGCGA